MVAEYGSYQASICERMVLRWVKRYPGLMVVSVSGVLDPEEYRSDCGICL